MNETVTYLDYAATSPVDPRVAAVMQEALAAGYGNAASAHAAGRAAAQRVAAARAQVAALVGAAPECIVFTSGATESNNLAILGIAARADAHAHFVSLRTEHKSILDPLRELEKRGARVTWLTPAADGVLDLAALRTALAPGTLLLSMLHANNETGVVQDLEPIAALCRELGVLLHVDAAQSAGKIPLAVGGIDLLSFTAHKLCGPQGIGALYVAPHVRPRLQPIVFGGGHERGLRSGTLPLHQVIGFGTACELAAAEGDADSTRIAGLRDRLLRGLLDLPGALLNGHATRRLPGILNLSFAGVEGENLFTSLAELAVSTGSACNSASAEPSFVLRALGRKNELAQSSLRYSFGRFSTQIDVDRAIFATRREILRLRGLSPAEPAPISDWSSEVSVGEAGAESTGTWVRWLLLRDADRGVKAARFQLYACPHTQAVCEWLAPQLAGRSFEDLVPGTPQQWARQGQVPIEKLGRLLVIEDALRACV
ncbi:MAG: aminotransferase class V-fold PLP-dependent enzyme [Steroidobacteraceae bacterium]